MIESQQIYRCQDRQGFLKRLHTKVKMIQNSGKFMTMITIIIESHKLLIECVSLTPNNGIITTHQTCLIGNDNLIANIDKFFNGSHFLDSFFARTVLVIS